MSPKTHIRQDVGTVIDCIGFMPVLYKFEEGWYNLYPRLHRVEKPLQLNPTSTPKWRFTPTQSLWSAGIYSEKELSALQDRLAKIQ